MAPGVVESLVAASGADRHLRFDHTVRIGERVRVLAGPFAGLIGELIRIDGAARVRICCGCWVGRCR